MQLRSASKTGLSIVAVVVIGVGAVACSSSGAGASGSAQASSAISAAPVITAVPTPWPSVIALPTEMPSAPTYEQTLPLFAYQGDQPFNVVEQTPAANQNGATIKDITFTGAAGDSIDAYLILPSGTGPFPGVLFEHLSGGTRDEFLSEATTLAQQQHFVCLLVSRPTSNLTSTDDLNETVFQIREMRRAVDLLIAQPGVDSSRLAYVGHSLGSNYGVTMNAVDKRFKTAILETPVPGNAIMAMYVTKTITPSVLIQFGSQDGLYTKDVAEAFAAQIPTAHTVSWYEAGHGLNGAATTDRAKWLADKLK